MTVNPKSIEALKPTQFQPGNNANPAGAPRGPRLTTALKKLLEYEIEVTDPITMLKGKQKIGEILALKTVAAALKGDKDAMKRVWEYIDGKPAQPLDIPGMKQHADLLAQVIKKAGKIGTK